MTRSLRQDKKQPQKRKQQEPSLESVESGVYWSRRHFGDGRTDGKERKISREKARETRNAKTSEYLFIFFSSWNFPPSSMLCALLMLSTATGTCAVPALV